MTTVPPRKFERIAVARWSNPFTEKVSQFQKLPDYIQNEPKRLPYRRKIVPKPEPEPEPEPKEEPAAGSAEESSKEAAAEAAEVESKCTSDLHTAEAR